MTQIIIKNVGPVRSVDMNLNHINLIIGAQSSGKSTIAKIISFCSWLEKECITNLSTIGFVTTEDFLNEIETFHSIKGYFKPDSYVRYESDSFFAEYDGPSDRISLRIKDLYAYLKPKIFYLPAERCISSIPGIERIELPENNLRNFIFDWISIRSHYETRMEIPWLRVNYYFDKSKGGDRVSSPGYDVPLSSASSGLKSTLPLMVLADYFLRWVYDHEENLSFEKRERNSKLRLKVFSDLVFRKLFGKDLQMLDQEGNASARMDEVQKRLEMRDPEVVRLNAEAMDQIQKLVTTQYSSLIIEEPEQNLFPSSQHDLVYDLIRMLKANDRKNHLTLTTHSPYILYAINNCVLGYLVRNQIPAEQLAQLKCRDSLIDPALVSVYQITTEGNLQKIQQEDGLIGKNYFDDTMKEIMDDFYSLIDYYND